MRASVGVTRQASSALGRFDESKRITRDAAARDDADFETLTHAARAAYALGDAGGAERLARGSREGVVVRRGARG